MENNYFASQKFNIILSIDLFSDSESIFEENFEEFLSVLDDYENKGKSFPKVLHNYLASFATLTDHCRILITQTPEAAVEVNKYIKEYLAESLLNNFIKDLRNYTLHYSIPLKLRQLKIHEDSIVVGELQFDKNSLLKWNGWNSKSKKYITSINHNIYIKETFIEHYNFIADFYNWLSSYFKEIYTSEFIEYEKFRKEFFPLKRAKD